MGWGVLLAGRAKDFSWAFQQDVASGLQLPPALTGMT
jgi:hypothetical protein